MHAWCEQESSEGVVVVAVDGFEEGFGESAVGLKGGVVGVE